MGKKKPSHLPDTHFPVNGNDELHRIDDWLWIPLKGEWRNIATKPEEIVRQRFIRHLHLDYGYAMEQMDQERRTMHGHRSPRADIIVWESAGAKAVNKTPVLVVECKAEAVEIHIKDYYQGESYTRAVGCEFFVAHNQRYTAVFKLMPGLPGEFVQINEIPKACDWGDAKRIEEIKNRLRAFDRKEFQDLLFDCHCILRDVHKMDPGRAFDTISKILFIKMYVERSGLYGTFTVEYLDRRAATRLPTDPLVHDGLFEQTKVFYKADELFSDNDRLDISEETFRRIVKKLERFDLSKTSDDIKGLAFERFLGTTFRGELGQYFTPRPVVDFMVELLNPQEGELICDPAAGSGGFLIRAFEHVRNQIAEDIQNQKDTKRLEIEALGLPEDEEERLIEEAFTNLNLELLPSSDDNRPIDTRVGRLAWKCIFGCDAEPRAARTAKMNMIMHGDGHGGIHYHDGLVDINGIFPERFDVVLTNPPFGSNVGEDQLVGASEETRVPTDSEYISQCRARYGEAWEIRHLATVAAAETKTKILNLFEVGKGKANRPTEIIFVERCLSLLRPGGRMGIVLPDGNLNNPSLSWMRRWVEDKAKLLAVVSLPEETFRSAAATVKASLVFLQKFTEEDKKAWEAAWATAHAKHDGNFNSQRDALCTRYDQRITCGDNEAIAEILRQLEGLGERRTIGMWEPGKPPAYPRGIGQTKVGNPKWQGHAKDKQAAAKLKQRFKELFTVDIQRRADALRRELTSKLRAIDEAHQAALWETVRNIFDYPVFVAAPKAVGITSTGDTGEHVPNDLPNVLTAYREFKEWVARGAKENDVPVFLHPSTA
ncbi:MAG: N-6 DNA methylase [Peptococcaceae bacterium]|nr:N-6 DNA methylase [Peptococcaceae bacterium]